jgi:hypothetical protein
MRIQKTIKKTFVCYPFVGKGGTQTIWMAKFNSNTSRFCCTEMQSCIAIQGTNSGIIQKLKNQEQTLESLKS